MISKISSTCFGQPFAHLQEHKTEIFTAYGIVSCCCGRQGFGEQQRGTTWCYIPFAVKISVLCSWRWAKDCPKHVELILEISKLLLLHLVGFFCITLPIMEVSASSAVSKLYRPVINQFQYWFLLLFTKIFSIN